MDRSRACASSSLILPSCERTRRSKRRARRECRSSDARASEADPLFVISPSDEALKHSLHVQDANRRKFVQRRREKHVSRRRRTKRLAPDCWKRGCPHGNTFHSKSDEFVVVHTTILFVLNELPLIALRKERSLLDHTMILPA